MRIALLALGLAACASDPLTEVVVTIEPTPTVLVQSPRSLSVRVYRQNDASPIFESSNAAWRNNQFTLVVAPENDRAASQPYRLEAEVKKDGYLAQARLIAGYVVGETRYVRVLLEDGCKTSCDENSTCYQGGCVSAQVDAQGFSIKREDAPASGKLAGSTLPDGVVTDAGEPVSTYPDAGELGSPVAVAPPTQDAGQTLAPTMPTTPTTTPTTPTDAGSTPPPVVTTDAGTTPGATPPPVPTTCTLPSAAACTEQASCEAGAAVACLRLALMYDASTASAGIAKSDAQAAVLYQRACTGGEMTACSNLGLLYGKGLGVALDEARAVALFRQACDANLLIACDHLGWMLRSGTGVVMNEALAIELFTRACNANIASGCNNLGVMYQEGRGTPKDEARAVPLLTRACDGGEWIACRTAAGIYERGAPGVAVNLAQARALYTRACTGGFADACAAADRLR